jgi:hypothetical protein
MNNLPFILADKKTFILTLMISQLFPLVAKEVGPCNTEEFTKIIKELDKEIIFQSSCK